MKTKNEKASVKKTRLKAVQTNERPLAQVTIQIYEDQKEVLEHLGKTVAKQAWVRAALDKAGICGKEVKVDYTLLNMYNNQMSA